MIIPKPTVFLSRAINFPEVHGSGCYQYLSDYTLATVVLYSVHCVHCTLYPNYKIAATVPSIE